MRAQIQDTGWQGSRAGTKEGNHQPLLDRQTSHSINALRVAFQSRLCLSQIRDDGGWMFDENVAEEGVVDLDMIIYKTKTKTKTRTNLTERKS